jgi:hypothetical protein
MVGVVLIVWIGLLMLLTIIIHLSRQNKIKDKIIKDLNNKINDLEI